MKKKHLESVSLFSCGAELTKEIGLEFGLLSAPASGAIASRYCTDTPKD